MKNAPNTFPIDRRSFLATSAVGAVSVLAFAGPATGTRAEPILTNSPPPRAKLRVLILGGTGFLGPAIVDACKAHGHAVTLFNRGKTENRIGIIDGVEKLFGNRDPEKHAEETDTTTPKGLSALEAAIAAGTKWDAVIDTSAYVPRIAKASATLLANACKTYCLISTVSVYASNETAGQDETAALLVAADPLSEEVMGNGGQNYGALKALCEKEVALAMPERSLIIRPGFIVGPGDPTDRFTYWPVRASKATAANPDMLAPAGPDDPVQVIDVRDLAAFCVRCLEHSTTGVFNVTGPTAGLTVGALLGACSRAVKASGGIEPNLVWVPAAFLAEHEVSVGGDLPITIPNEGESAGFHQRSIAKAIAAGLTTRPIDRTCEDLLAWWPKEVARRDRVGKQMVEDAKAAGKPEPKLPDPTLLRAGLGSEKELKVLEAWKSFQGKK